MNPALVTTIGVVLVAAIGVVSSVWVARLQRSSSPYDALAARVVDLEKADQTKGKKIATLEASLRRTNRALVDQGEDLDVLSDALWEQQNWIESGAVPPPPTITQRTLEVMHRRRAARNEDIDSALTYIFTPDGQNEGPSETKDNP